jgi:hypothetical protein
MNQDITAKFVRLVLMAIAFACLSPAQVSLARGHNPAVSNSFFLMLDSLAGNCGSATSQVATVAGSVNSVSWAQAACLVQESQDGKLPPMVIEVVTSDANQCDQYKDDPQLSSDICQQQLVETTAAASARPDVLYLSVDAAQNRTVTSGADVRVLPTHIFIHSYSDVSHYEALAVMGYLDRVAMVAATKEIFNP